jgi:hypothetical protein
MRYGELDIYELGRIFNGHFKREQAEWYRAAAIGAWILNANGAKTTPEKLLGPAFKKPTHAPAPKETDED